MAIRGGQIINISGKEPVIDPEYRYKMPAVFGKIEGRGNGIKTVIPNIIEVGLSLHRQPSEVNKFFGCELGAQTTYSEETERAVINGSHTDKALQDLIHRYVEIFVLCPNCGLPETDYKIKNECIFHKCAACGSKDMVDMNHKLCTYILAQDKKAKKDKKEKEKKKEGKDEKKKDKEKKKDSDDEKKKDKKDKDKKKDKKKDEKKKDKEKGDKEEGEKDKDGNYLEAAIFGKKDDDGFGDDGDAVSVDSEVGVDDAGALQLAIDGTKKFLSEHEDASVHEISEIVTNQQMASSLKSHDKIHIFVGAAFSPQFFKNKEVEKYAPVLRKITNNGITMQRHLIAALEGLCVDTPKNFPVFLKQLYDEDALDEDVILEWAAEGRNDFTLASVDEDKRAVLRGEAEPVVVWLQAADSDDEEEDDEE